MDKAIWLKRINLDVKNQNPVFPLFHYTPSYYNAM